MSSRTGIAVLALMLSSVGAVVAAVAAVSVPGTLSGVIGPVLMAGVAFVLLMDALALGIYALDC